LRRLTIQLIPFGALFVLAGCPEHKNKSEKAAEKIEDAADKVGGKVDKAADKFEDKVDDRN